MVKRHKLSPEPGAWVCDTFRGLPELDAPEHEVGGPLTARQVADEVEYHGLGFCILEYITPDKITDPILQRRWGKARKALQSVKMYLEREDRKPRKDKKPTKKSSQKLGKHSGRSFKVQPTKRLTIGREI